MKSLCQGNINQRSFRAMFSSFEACQRLWNSVQSVTHKASHHLIVLGLMSAALTFLVTRSARVTLSVAALAALSSIAAGKRIATRRIPSRAEAEPRRKLRNSVSDVTSGERRSLTGGIPAVTAINPESGVTPLELLRVAASAASLSWRPAEKAIVHKALELGIPVRRPEDFRYLREGSHCWIDDVPTLIGSRPFLAEMGVFVSAGEHQATGTTEIAVAQGHRLLGALAISNISQQWADNPLERPPTSSLVEIGKSLAR